MIAAISFHNLKFNISNNMLCQLKKVSVKIISVV